MRIHIPGIPFSKRLFDIAASLVGLLVVSPLLIIIAVLTVIFQGPPVFFRQRRPGYKGKPFTLLKFRTMRDLRREDGTPFPDEVRITAFGRVLRSLSLDELPELFNVLRGDMSLVGPRPLLMHYLDLYTPYQARRHEVLPGITGWAQIHGRNALSWEEKFKHDVWYVDHWSFSLDLKILFITLWKAISREGINQPGHITAEEFKGSRQSQE